MIAATKDDATRTHSRTSASLIGEVTGFSDGRGVVRILTRHKNFQGNLVLVPRQSCGAAGSRVKVRVTGSYSSHRLHRVDSYPMSERTRRILENRLLTDAERQEKAALANAANHSSQRKANEAAKAKWEPQTDESDESGTADRRTRRTTAKSPVSTVHDATTGRSYPAYGSKHALPESYMWDFLYSFEDANTGNRCDLYENSLNGKLAAVPW